MIINELNENKEFERSCEREKKIAMKHITGGKKCGWINIAIHKTAQKSSGLSILLEI